MIIKLLGALLYFVTVIILYTTMLIPWLIFILLRAIETLKKPERPLSISQFIELMIDAD